jgi:nucleoside-diphosphate-sugar epimerase
MCRALVTGATGFIGRHLVPLLQERGYRVRAIVRSPVKFASLYPDAAGIDVVPGDLGDPACLAGALDGISHVFHLAGVTKAIRPDEYHRGNVEATRRLVEAVRGAPEPPRRFLHVSSLAAMGPSATSEPPACFDPPAPLTHYGRSKLEAEAAVWSLAGICPVTVFRPPVVFGPADTDVLHFFRTVARGWLPIVGHDRKRVSLVYAADLAVAMADAVVSNATVGKSYYPCYTEAYRWSELGRIAARALGRKCRVVVLPLSAVRLVALAAELAGRIRRRPTILNLEKVREMRAPYWVCSPSDAMHDFGFRPRTAIHEAFRETIDWYRAHGQLS